MTIYLALISIVVAAAIIAQNRRNLSILFTSLIFLSLWVIASFRSIDIGVDTYAYAHYFNEVSLGNIDVIEQIRNSGLFGINGFENGYKLLNYYIGLFTDNFTVLLAISYAFIFFSFYRLIKKYSPNLLISTLVYIPLFFFASMNHFRQALAMAIVTWSFKYILERKPIRYAALIALATLVHQASLIMLPAYFLYGKRLHTRGALAYLGMAVVLFLALDPVITTLISGNERYEGYLDHINSFKLGSYLIAATYASILVTLKIFDARSPKKDYNDGTRWLYIHMATLAVLIAVVSIKVNSLSRFIDYFMIFSVLSVPYFITKSPSDRLTRVFTIALISALYIYAFSTMLLRPEWMGIWPYENIF